MPSRRAKTPRLLVSDVSLIKRIKLVCLSISKLANSNSNQLGKTKLIANSNYLANLLILIVILITVT